MYIYICIHIRTPFFSKRMLRSCRSVVSLTAARFLGGAAGAPVGCGGGSCPERVRRPAWSSCWTKSCRLCRTLGLLFAASTGPNGPLLHESHASVQWGRKRPSRPRGLAAVFGKAQRLPGYAAEARNTRFRKNVSCSNC